MLRADGALQVRRPESPESLGRTPLPPRRQLDGRGHRRLAADPGIGRLPDGGVGAPVARPPELHDLRNARLGRVRPELDVGNPLLAPPDAVDAPRALLEMLGVLVETVVHGLGLADQILDAVERHEAIAERLATLKPEPGEAAVQRHDHGNAVAPGRDLVEGALAAEHRRPRPAQQAVTRRLDMQRMPAPGDQPGQRLLSGLRRKAAEGARHPEREGAVDRLGAVGDAIEPDGRLRHARGQQVDDLLGEVGIGRQAADRPPKDLRRQPSEPPRQPELRAGDVQRGTRQDRADGALAGFGRAIASRQREDQRRKCDDEIVERRRTAGELADPLAISRMKDLEPSLAIPRSPQHFLRPGLQQAGSDASTHSCRHCNSPCSQRAPSQAMDRWPVWQKREPADGRQVCIISCVRWENRRLVRNFAAACRLSTTMFPEQDLFSWQCPPPPAWAGGEGRGIQFSADIGWVEARDPTTKVVVAALGLAKGSTQPTAREH